jgi:DNA mismatch repair protein MutS2
MEVLNERSAKDLEWEKILSLVASHSASSLGAEEVKSLRPSADPAWILREFKLLEEMEEALRGGFSLGAIHDLRPILAEAKEHGILPPEAFLKVAETLESAADLSLALKTPKHPNLARLAERISDQSALLTQIWRTIDERAEIREDATPKLRNLFLERRKLTEEIQETLRKFLEKNREHVQDAIITKRGGRYVVPLKTGAKALGLVVHEASGSGQTLFAEPAEVVPLNNRLREVEDEIDREKHRILFELTAKLLSHAAEIEEDLRILAKIDSLFARARFGQRWRATIPKLSQEPRIELWEARHPLLGDRAVPISISFGEGKPVVVITGPNTGGKTVTLKTIGLFCALFQAGIPIPADDRTALPVFEKIRTDIGEEQSIEQSLSTFSSHMKNIIGILGEIDERSLVILDELGAGTDPQEGAALALAILERLLEVGCMAAVATHLTPVKLFAIAHPRILSCSMEFDLETLSPTFRVLQGVPGQSCALLVAERLGLPSELVERAKKKLSAGEIRAEEIIEELARERAAARRLRANLEVEREALRKIRAEYENRLQALKERKAAALSRELKKARGRDCGSAKGACGIDCPGPGCGVRRRAPRDPEKGGRAQGKAPRGTSSAQARAKRADQGWGHRADCVQRGHRDSDIPRRGRGGSGGPREKDHASPFFALPCGGAARALAEAFRAHSPDGGARDFRAGAYRGGSAASSGPLAGSSFARRLFHGPDHPRPRNRHPPQKHPRAPPKNTVRERFPPRPTQ